MNIIIGGCVKNCEKYIEDVFNNIEIISKHFNIQKIICSYDNSNDKTLLELCKQKKKFEQLEIIINKQPVTQYRTINISNARNRILDYIESNGFKTDYLIMMDFDDVSSKKINIEPLLYAFEIKDKWDILTFMNEKYYDYWALSFDDYIYSCWHNNNPKKIIQCMRKCLYNKIKNKEYIECLSSFNGIGIFKLDKIKDIRYTSVVKPTFYKNKFMNNINNIEKQTNTKYNFDREHILDCEHRLYQITCTEKYKTRNIILNKNIFPKYDGEHANF
jgi:hypothetical protein